MAGYEAGGFTVLCSQMKGLNALIESLTPLQGLRTRARAHPTEVISLFSHCPTGPYTPELSSSNFPIMNSQPPDVELIEHGRFQNRGVEPLLLIQSYYKAIKCS